MKRLFFAYWPDDIARQHCVKVVQALQKGKARTVKPNNLHVTLLFLGSVSADKEMALRQAAATIPVPTSSLCFDRLSFWKKPGVICLTTSTLSPDVKDLVEHLTTIAKALDIPIEERPYQPHVTLLRNSKVLATIDFQPIIWRSNSICLVQSHSVLNNVEYKVLQTWEAH